MTSHSRICRRLLCLFAVVLPWAAFSISSPFLAPPVTVPVGDNPVDVVAADMNGDGHLDLVLAHGSAQTISVLTNKGLGQFELALTILVSASPSKVLVVEVNGDARPDLIVSYRYAGFSVHTNDGAGGFALASTGDISATPEGIVTADLNNDGWVELILADGRYLEVLTNDHHGEFTLAQSVFSGFYPFTVVAADFNGDGSMDVIGGNFESVPTLVTNNGSGLMVFSHYLPWIFRPDTMASADVDNNGSTDWLIGSGSALAVLTNDGSGGFALARTNKVNCSTLRCADLNGDGAIDLLVPDAFSNRIAVLLNDGGGKFTTNGTVVVGNYPAGLAVADLDGDGGPDVVSANSIDNSLSVILNYARLSLTIEQANPGTFLLSWPLTAPTFHLETATNAMVLLQWLNIGPPFTTNANRLQHTINTPNSYQLFRLAY